MTIAKKLHNSCLEVDKHTFVKLNVSAYDDVLIDNDAIKCILKLPKWVLTSLGQHVCSKLIHT